MDYKISVAEQHIGISNTVYMYAYTVLNCNDKIILSGGIYGSQVGSRKEARDKIEDEVKMRISMINPNFELHWN